jgi:predicted DNA-binding transcriptional regulator AlpA
MSSRRNKAARRAQSLKGAPSAISSRSDVLIAVADAPQSGDNSIARPESLSSSTCLAGEPNPAWLPKPTAANALLEARACARESTNSNHASTDALQFLRPSDVCRLLRISKPTLWRLRRTTGFPEPTELTDRVIGWRRSEIEVWLATRFGGTRASNRSSQALQPAVSREVRNSPPLEPDPALLKPKTSHRSKRAERRTSDEQLTLLLTFRR